MKTYLSILAVALIGCGSSGPSISPTPSPSATPTATPTSTPTPTPLADALVGNWIEGTNTLNFKSDGTAKSNTNSLNWSIDGAGNIVFTANAVNVDTCAYDILTAGGLTSTLTTTLDLACEKAGALTYTRTP